ncbi:MAG: hypothetical protein AAGJ81_10720 [Verrucomicrobiota bacterium]
MKQPILVHVDANAIHFRVEGRGGMYPKPLPASVTIPEGATTAWDGKALTLTVIVTTPSDVEGDEPTVTTTPFVLTEAEIAAAWAFIPPPPELPLTDQLKALLDNQPALIRANFEPLRRPVWDAIERGDYEVAKILIQGATVPPELESVRQEMLSKFPTE